MTMTGRILTALAALTFMALAVWAVYGPRIGFWLTMAVLAGLTVLWARLARRREQRQADRHLDRLIRDERNRRFLKAQGVTCESPESLSRPPRSSRSTLPDATPGRSSAPYAPSSGPMDPTLSPLLDASPAGTRWEGSTAGGLPAGPATGSSRSTPSTPAAGPTSGAHG